MDPKDVLIKNSVKFYNELDAKPLFLQLKYIFPTSVAVRILLLFKNWIYKNICIYPTSLHEQDVTQDQFLSRI